MTGQEPDRLTEQFESHRDHLRRVAYRMLGSMTEAEDAVQETWIRLDRTDTGDVRNLGGWLTTVVGRVCLNMLRARRVRGDEAAVVQVPDPIVLPTDARGPEEEAVLADMVGVALLVVLDTLEPAERLAFVLHDMFAVPYEEIGPMVGRTPTAARQLASRARRRVQGTPVADGDPAGHREIVDAFFSAGRNGDFEALIELLDPDVVVRTDRGAGRVALARGRTAVADQALTYARPRADVRPALVNGDAGAVVLVNGRAVAIMAFAVAAGRVVSIDALVDPDRLRRVDVSAVAP